MSITTRMPKIPEDQVTPLVAQLLEIIQLQIEEIQLLKDEIARLKGQKPRPKIRASNLEKRRGRQKTKKPKKRVKRSKTKKLEIHEAIPIRPDNLPDGSKFKGYQDYVVQDLIIANWNTCYRRERWQLPCGDYIVGQLPKEVDGTHFGPTLTAFVLHQYYGCHVTQPLIVEQLHELGIDISRSQVNNIIIKDKDRFHQEKDQILPTALTISGYIHVDDTGARHNGQNGYCTHIGNEYFAWFKSTASKSRINFLNLLSCGHADYVLNDKALQYMAVQRMPGYQLAKLSKVKNRAFKNLADWSAFLSSKDISTDYHRRIATEAALVGSIAEHTKVNPDLAIISDDAGQFNVFLHALCWVHAERSIEKLIGLSNDHRELLEQTKTDIWQLYNDLKNYRIDPDRNKKVAIEHRFDELFTRKTGYASLDLALKQIHRNKSELLLVLQRPDIPLHNNLSERDIREYVKRRKVSGSTRSDTGKRCRDTFTSLKKTSRKLGISFWQYLKDRVEYHNQLPPLAQIMTSQMTRY
jgi:hypothetical protein